MGGLMSDPIETTLALARRHVQDGKCIVAAQKKIISEIKACGGDARGAEDLLDTFRRTQAIFEDHLGRLAKDKG